MEVIILINITWTVVLTLFTLHTKIMLINHTGLNDPSKHKGGQNANNYHV